MAYSKSATVLGAQANNHRDEKRHYPVAAGFMQFKLPILANLNADVVGRYEKFYSDITDKDNDIAVPAVALKWDPLDWLSLRTSWGKTFSQVNPPADTEPVKANGAAPVAYETYNYPNLDVRPEKGENFSVGFIVNAGNFHATVDYNAITIEDYTRTLTANNIVTALLAPGELISNAGRAHQLLEPIVESEHSRPRRSALCPTEWQRRVHARIVETQQHDRCRRRDRRWVQRYGRWRRQFLRRAGPDQFG